MLNQNGASIAQATNGHGAGEPSNSTSSNLNENNNEPQPGPSNGNVNGNATLTPPIADSPLELDIIKIIGQHLRSLGLHRAVAALSDEAGISIEHPLAAKLQNHVMQGSMDDAIDSLTDLEPFLIGSNATKKMRFLLLENKFLELLSQNKIMEALTCLREQLSPLKHNVKRVHQLSSCLMMQVDNPELELYRTNLTEARNRLMEKLQKFLPANIMLPPRRLRTLLANAQAYQVERCDFHSSANSPGSDLMTDISLLSDHLCDRSSFPCYTTQILTDHCDEIWVCKFSHDGLKLATGSKDSTVMIWDVDPVTLQLSHRKTLEGHTLGVSCLAWSPDDNLLLVCGYEDSSDLWMWDITTGELKLKMSHSADDSLTACAWQSNGNKFVTGGTRGQFYQCDLEGTVLDTWEGVRLHGVRCLKDGETVLAADNHCRVKAYNFEKMEDDNLVTEDHSIMSFTVDSTDRYVLLNLALQGLHLWDIKDKTLVMKYRGITQGFYTVHSCFGGVNEKFVASGSEDSRVYIFHRQKETPIAILEGHSRTVNCVSWNPRFPTMLASVSDDATVRIWGPNPNSDVSNDGCGESIREDDSETDINSGPGGGSNGVRRRKDLDFEFVDPPAYEDDDSNGERDEEPEDDDEETDDGDAPEPPNHSHDNGDSTRETNGCIQEESING